jgi:hypothetical protein
MPCGRVNFGEYFVNFASTTVDMDGPLIRHEINIDRCSQLTYLRMFPTIPFIYFLVCGISGLALWYKMLGIMEQKGRKVNYFWVTPGQLIEFGRVIREESDPKLKNKYRLILWLQIALIPIYIVGMFIVIGLTN